MSSISFIAQACHTSNAMEDQSDQAEGSKLLLLPREVQLKIYEHVVQPWSLHLLHEGEVANMNAMLSHRYDDLAPPRLIPGQQLASTCRHLYHVVREVQYDAFTGHLFVGQALHFRPAPEIQPWLNKVHEVHYIRETKANGGPTRKLTRRLELLPSTVSSIFLDSMPNLTRIDFMTICQTKKGVFDKIFNRHSGGLELVESAFNRSRVRSMFRATMLHHVLNFCSFNHIPVRPEEFLSYPCVRYQTLWWWDESTRKSKSESDSNKVVTVGYVVERDGSDGPRFRYIAMNLYGRVLEIQTKDMDEDTETEGYGNLDNEPFDEFPRMWLAGEQYHWINPPPTWQKRHGAHEDGYYWQHCGKDDFTLMDFF